MSDENLVTKAEAGNPEAQESDDAGLVERVMARKTRRSFLVGGLAAIAGAGAWEWLDSRRPDDGVMWPLRLTLRANEQLWRDYSSPRRLARTFDPADIEAPRPNGNVGLENEPDPDWSLAVDGITDADGPLTLGMSEIQKLPKAEMITELKCIEGWSRVLQWGGVRFQDFAATYAAQNTDPNSYVGLETPEQDYYVGLDMASAMHPQTLLCWEMNGAPLTAKHGAPLRLVVPLKYGIKNLKRIGRIVFSATRPADYWSERGYDYYAGF